MNNLPKELLSKILNHLPDDNLKSLLEVHPFWSSTINSTIGFHINIGTDCAFTMQDIEWSEPEKIQEVGARSCYIGQMLCCRPTYFAYPQTLKSLFLEGAICPFNFKILVTPLTALSHISFHFAALCGIKIFPSTFTVRVLRTFNMHSHQVATVFRQPDAVTCLDNLSTLLNNIRSSRLEKLILDLPFVPHCEELMFHSITSCVSSHERTLLTLQVHWAVSFRSPPNETETLKGFKSHIDWQLYQGTNMKRICFAGCDSMRSYEEWKNFFWHQKNLKEFFYMNEHAGSVSLNSIRKNSATLTKILIHISAFNEFRSLKEIDFEVFKDCINLTHLLLRGRSYIGEQHVNGNAQVSILTPRVLNAHFLPKTIQVLSIREVHVKKNDIAIIANDFPLLRKLRLTYAGTVDVFGITPTSVLNIIERRTIQEIEIIRSFNRDSFSSIGEFCFIAHAMLNEIWRTGQCSIDLRGDNEYYVKTRSMFVYPVEDTAMRSNDVCDVVFQ